MGEYKNGKIRIYEWENIEMGELEYTNGRI